MVGESTPRERQAFLAFLAAGSVLLLLAVVALTLVARSEHDAPEPLAGLTAEQVAIARAHGLELRVNAIATEAAPDGDAERAAEAALGRDTFASLRSSVTASLARVIDDGQPVQDGLVWVVFADGVPAPSLGAGESRGTSSVRKFVVVDRDSFEVLAEE